MLSTHKKMKSFLTYSLSLLSIVCPSFFSFRLFPALPCRPVPAQTFRLLIVMQMIKPPQSSQLSAAPVHSLKDRVKSSVTTDKCFKLERQKLVLFLKNKIILSLTLWNFRPFQENTLSCLLAECSTFKRIKKKIWMYNLKSWFYG